MGNLEGCLGEKSLLFPRGLRPTAPVICAQAESAFPTLGAWRGPGRDSCLGHIFSPEPSGWFWLCNYSSPSSLQTWPSAPWAQDSGICCLKWHFLLALESPWSTCPELGTPGHCWPRDLVAWDQDVAPGPSIPGAGNVPASLNSF